MVYCYISELISECETQQWGPSQNSGATRAAAPLSVGFLSPTSHGMSSGLQTGQELSFSHCPLFSCEMM